MHKRLPLFLVFLSALCLFSSHSQAWNATGHKVVAYIAWDEMTPKTRAAIAALLKQHPRYEKDLLLDAPANQTADQQARTAFATAATWPDMVRSPDNPMHFTSNHPAWHYIDIPYAVDGQPVVEQQSDATGPKNAVEALNQCVADMKDPKKSDADKAVALCWVEHLTGDIHQPLHSVSMYSKQYPNGDQGGNAQMVLRDGHYNDTAANLHYIWDSMVGNFASDDLDQIEAAGMHSDPKLARQQFTDQLKVTDAMDWAKESYALAVKYVYLDGTLKSTPAHRGRGPSTQLSAPIPGLPPGYLRTGEQIAAQRIALAGYRLADELNSIFDPK